MVFFRYIYELQDHIKSKVVKLIKGKKNVSKNLLLGFFTYCALNYLGLSNACWLKFNYFSGTNGNVILKRNNAKIKCPVAKLLTSGVFQNGGRKQFCFILFLMSPATLTKMVPFLCFSI